MRNSHMRGEDSEYGHTPALFWGTLVAVGLVTFTMGYMLGQSSSIQSGPGLAVLQPKHEAPQATFADMGEKELDEKIKQILNKQKQNGAVDYTFSEVLNQTKSPASAGAATIDNLDDNPSPSAKASASAKATADTTADRLAKDRTKLMAMAESLPPGAKYSVQVASFQNADQADGFSDSLKEKGYESHVQVAEVPGKGTWYRVRVGAFSDKLSAQKTAQTLEKQEKLSPIVVSLQ